MSLELLREVLLWCLIINIGLLYWWFGLFVFAHDWVYRMHTKWFKISVEKFDALHYGGLMLFKISVFAFNIVPYIALAIVT